MLSVYCQKKSFYTKFDFGEAISVKFDLKFEFQIQHFRSNSELVLSSKFVHHYL